MRSQRKDRQPSRTSMFLSWHSQRTGWEKSSFSSSSRSPKSGSSFLQQLTLSGFLQKNSLLCILSLPNPLGLWTKANSSECYCWITPCMFTICMAFSGWPCRGDCCPARGSFRVAGDEEWWPCSLAEQGRSACETWRRNMITDIWRNGNWWKPATEVSNEQNLFDKCHGKQTERGQKGRRGLRDSGHK